MKKSLHSLFLYHLWVWKDKTYIHCHLSDLPIMMKSCLSNSMLGRSRSPISVVVAQWFSLTCCTRLEMIRHCSYASTVRDYLSRWNCPALPFSCQFDFAGCFPPKLLFGYGPRFGINRDGIMSRLHWQKFSTCNDESFKDEIFASNYLQKPCWPTYRCFCINSGRKTPS